MVGSVYLITGHGLDADNAAILHLLGAAVAKHGRPFVVGGDFNMTPGEIRQWHGWKKLGAAIASTTEATCGNRTIDYVAVSEPLLNRVESVSMLDEIETTPRR